MTLRALPATLLAAIAIVGPACHQRVGNSEHRGAMQALVGGTPPWVEDTALGKRLWTTAQAFYDSRQHLPVWIDGNEPTPHWEDLVRQLEYSEAHGLDAAVYGGAAFERLREESRTTLSGTRFPVEEVPELDARMPYAYLRYASDLLGWTHSPTSVHPSWLTSPKREDLAARLTAAVSQSRVRESLEERAPTEGAQPREHTRRLSARVSSTSGSANGGLKGMSWSARGEGRL